MRRTTLPRAIFGLASIAMLGSSSLLGQQQPSPAPAPSPGGAGGTTTTPTTPGRSPIPTNPTQQQPGRQDQMQFPEMQRPMFLSGRVMLDDGTPPPEPATVERICNGVVRPEGYTDSKGRFSFELGRNSGMMMDASVSGPGDWGSMPGSSSSRQQQTGMSGVRERDLMGCELRAALPGFRSDLVNLSGRRFLDNPDVGTIVLHRLGNVEGLTISATSMAAPKDAKKLLDKGRESLKKNKLEDAQKNFEKAVELYPKYAVAWYELGSVQDRLKNVDGARKSFSESLNADAKYISPYEGLAQIAARENKWQEVADVTDRMIRLNPVDFPRAYFYNAVAKLNLQKLDDAEKSAARLLEMDTQHRIPKAEHVMGIILAQKQDLPGAAAHIKKFIEVAPPGTDVDLAKKQLDQIQKAVSAGNAGPEQK